MRRNLRNRGLIRSSVRPPPVPGGWITGPPDFVGVGAQRCGTTWWYRSLVRHPQIQAAAKELHFFDAYFGREFGPTDVDAYRRLFPRPPGQLIGEWTPRYMHDFWTPALLSQAAPEARILVLLRDPLSRYQSGISHELDAMLGSIRRHRRGYVAAMVANDTLSRALYSGQLRRLLQQFDRDRVLVLQYERCVREPGPELRRTYEFLGVDPEAGLPAPPTDRVGRGHPQLLPPDRVSEVARRMIEDDVEQLKAIAPEIDLSLWSSAGGGLDGGSERA